MTDEDGQLASFKQKRLAVKAEEPPTLCTLNEICHNDLIVAMGYKRESDPALFAEVPRANRLLAQFIDFGKFAAH